jgi:hypothetical protein
MLGVGSRELDVVTQAESFDGPLDALKAAVTLVRSDHDQARLGVVVTEPGQDVARQLGVGSDERISQIRQGFGVVLTQRDSNQ